MDSFHHAKNDIKPQSNFIFGRIQCLRFFAATAVVLFHSFGTCQKYFDDKSSLNFLAHGDYGVDLFFVISGFIIMVTTSRRAVAWTDFLVGRLVRIVPMYWLATITMFTLMGYLNRASPHLQDIEYLLNSMFYTTWAYGRLPIVYPGWTLEYEMAFYVLVSVAIAVSGRIWPLVILTINACVCGGIVFAETGITASRFLFVVNPMYLEFALGIIIAHVVVGRPLPTLSSISLAVVFGIILFLSPWDEWRWRVLVAGLPASIVVLCAAWIDQRKMHLSRLSRYAARLGDASYSIYLVQVFVISIACKVLATAAPKLPVDAAILVVSLATLLVALVVHQTIERPMSRWFHRRSRLALNFRLKGGDRVAEVV